MRYLLNHSVSFFYCYLFLKVPIMVCLGILILKSTENFQVILSEIIELWKRFFESALYFRWREKRQSLVPGRATRSRLTNCCLRQPSEGNLLFRQQFSTQTCDRSNLMV